jgi:hypothetical protein
MLKDEVFQCSIGLENDKIYKKCRIKYRNRIIETSK